MLVEKKLKMNSKSDNNTTNRLNTRHNFHFRNQNPTKQHRCGIYPLLDPSTIPTWWVTVLRGLYNNLSLLINVIMYKVVKFCNRNVTSRQRQELCKRLILHYSVLHVVWSLRAWLDPEAIEDLIYSLTKSMVIHIYTTYLFLRTMATGSPSILLMNVSTIFIF